MRALFAAMSLCLLATASCGSAGNEAPKPNVSPRAADAGVAADAGPPPGYVRYTTSAVTVAPGTSTQWIQWVAAPFDHDVDVADVQGKQSFGGHHALLTSMKEMKSVGTQVAWQDSNFASAQFLGGIGGEGGNSLEKLPPPAVSRLPKGRAIAIMTHYLNAGSTPLEGTSQLDVRYADPSPSDVVASLFTNTSVSFQVPAQGSLHVDLKCAVKQDVSLLMFANHMHQWGTAVSTSVVDSTGTRTVIKDDPAWDPEWTTNPNFTKFTVAAPYVLHAGDTLTTSCDWSNTTASPLSFPTEMCVFVAHYLGSSDLTCVGGTFMAL